MYSAQQIQLISSFGEFFSLWDWDQYATFTFGRHMSPSGSVRQWNDFVNALGRTSNGPVGWVRADEQRWSGYGRPAVPLHFHALLKYRNVPAPEAVAGLWKARAGDAKVEVYRAGGGAGLYMAKMFPFKDSHYDLGGLGHFPRSEDSPIRGSGK
jgi:hypothetical protein